jgi:protein phosphatase
MHHRAADMKSNVGATRGNERQRPGVFKIEGGGMAIEVASKTDPGKVRHNNEDRVLADSELGLLMVADGMGGHQAGETASEIAVTTIASLFREGAVQGGDMEDLIRQCIERANLEIRRQAAENPDLHGMGTTLVLALCDASKVLIAHAGDSRAYLLHEGRLSRLTEDHSLVEQMIRRGEITPKEALRHRLRNVVTRSLGNQAEAQPEIQSVAWSAGDCLMLCSDGLTNMLDDPRLQKLIVEGGCDLTHTCDRLVEAANHKGGTDNISVILARNT